MLQFCIALRAPRPPQGTFARSRMITINCEYDCFHKVHWGTTLQVNDRTGGAVEIIKAFVDRGMKENVTCSDEVYSRN